MTRTVFLLVLALSASVAHGDIQRDPNYLVNGDFGHGLTGWVTGGTVQPGDGSVRLGPGNAAIRQRYAIPGLRIVEFGAHLHLSSPNVRGLVRAQCFDAHGRLLMDLTQAVDPKKGSAPAGDGVGIYFKTQAHTAYLVVGVENDSPAPAEVTARAVELHDYDRERIDHPPLCNLDQYMEPIWEGNTVYNETLLLLSEKGGAAHGRLMFTPRRILSVRDSALHESYVEGRDYRVEGPEIIALPGTLMPTMYDFAFPPGPYPWLSVTGRHIAVTYTHDDRWAGPTARYQGDRLPRTVAKLRAGDPLTVVADGDSITLGINVSGYRGDPPYMPPWADLFAHRLGNHVRLFNVALGGMTAQWGADNARDAVAALKPDLVLIAFGMNDFWSVLPEEFRKHIVSMMDAVRVKNPNAEFILISSIRFDPAYTDEPTYVGHMTAYAEALRGLAGPGVAFLDMTAISEALYHAKRAKDLLSDPMHPDDFLARWYAQGLVALVTEHP